MPGAAPERGPGTQQPRRTEGSGVLRAWTAGLLLVAAAVIVATHRDYGITWDEPVQSAYGEAVLAYFRGDLHEPGAAAPPQLRAYGPAFELAAALLYAPRPARKYEIRHLLIAMTALLAVPAVIGTAALVSRPLAPIFASLALVTLPRFYGDAFNNSKDAPFAALFACAVFAICRFALAPRSFGATLLCGVVIGASLAVRPGGLPIALLLFAAAAGWAALRARAPGTVAIGALVVWATAWLVMVACWPWAHEAPVANPLDAVRTAFAFPKAFPVLFEGRTTMSDQLPRYYLLKYVLITTPPGTLLLGGVGLLRAAWRLRDREHPESLVSLVALLWLGTPLLGALAIGPNVYDGMRHALFVLPALALLSGIGTGSLAEFAPPGRPRRAAAVALAILLAAPIASLVRLHPYQTTYFNAWVGGLRGAAGRYETDYWLASYKEAIEWVNARAARRPDRPLQVLVAVDGYARDCAARFLGPDVAIREVVDYGIPGEIPPPYAYYVSTTRYGFDRSYPGSPVVHSIGRDGAVFTVIRAREPAGQGSAGRVRRSPRGPRPASRRGPICPAATRAWCGRSAGTCRSRARATRLIERYPAGTATTSARRPRRCARFWATIPGCGRGASGGCGSLRTHRSRAGTARSGSSRWMRRRWRYSRPPRRSCSRGSSSSRPRRGGRRSPPPRSSASARPTWPRVRSTGSSTASSTSRHRSWGGHSCSPSASTIATPPRSRATACSRCRATTRSR